MPSGGKRPGAGAPRGNLNALKHGRASPHLRRLAHILAQEPDVRSLLLEFRRQEEHATRRARRTAEGLFQELLLGIPPQPDPEFNQIIRHLQRISHKLGTQNIAENDQLAQADNQTTPEQPCPTFQPNAIMGKPQAREER